MASAAKAINGTEKQQKLFNQSYKAEITPLIIYGLGGIHTQAHTYPQAGAQLVKNPTALISTLYTAKLRFSMTISDISQFSHIIIAGIEKIPYGYHMDCLGHKIK